MKLNTFAALIAAAVVAASCTTSETVQTSKSTAIVQTSAAPICGGQGAARTAYKQAAIATLKAGYDSFIIMSGEAANNVRMVQMPGSYNTYGNMNRYGGFSATTTYSPGPVMAAGTHNQSFGVKMFKNGEPGSSEAISARDALGPDWQKILKNGIHTC
jgi:hypothetical protein